MQQIPSQKFVSDCGKAILYVDNDMPVGILHDFTMQAKGHFVDIMVNAHKQDEATAEEQKNASCAE